MISRKSFPLIEKIKMVMSATIGMLIKMSRPRINQQMAFKWMIPLTRSRNEAQEKAVGNPFTAERIEPVAKMLTASNPPYLRIPYRIFRCC